MAQSGLARAVGLSPRTAQRWALGPGEPSAYTLEQVARMLDGRDPALAARIRAEVDAAFGSSGVPEEVRPRRPAPSAAPAPTLSVVPSPELDPKLVSLLVDAVVAAAADVLAIAPAKMRPALAAALTAAALGGLTVRQRSEVLAVSQPANGSQDGAVGILGDRPGRRYPGTSAPVLQS